MKKEKEKIAKERADELFRKANALNKETDIMQKELEKITTLENVSDIAKPEYELCVQSAPVEWEQKNNRVLNPETGLPKCVHDAYVQGRGFGKSVTNEMIFKIESITDELFEELLPVFKYERDLHQFCNILATKIYNGELKTIGVKQ